MLKAGVADREAILLRAKSYPYPRPEGSFIFCNGRALCFDHRKWGSTSLSPALEIVDSASKAKMSLNEALEVHRLPAEVLQAERIAVLAIGSNGSPVQLARKFPADLFPGGVLIPVIRAVLQDFDVVYAPVIAAYGSSVATLAYSPDTKVELAVTFLTDDQLSHMHKTEGSYNLVRLTQIKLLLAEDLTSLRSSSKRDQTCMDSILLYNHQLGALQLPQAEADLSAFSIKEIAAEGRQIPERSQIEMLASIQSYSQSMSQKDKPEESSAAEEQTLNDFIIGNVSNSASRGELNSLLAKTTLAFAYSEAEIVSRLSTLHT